MKNVRISSNTLRKAGRLWLMPALIAFVLIACAPEDTGTPDTSEGYPIASNDIDRGYPVSQPGLEAFEANLTPNAPDPEFDSETGAVTMTLFYKDSDRPVRGQLFFAASTMPVEVEGDDSAFIPVLDQNADPNAFSDSHGVVNFSFLPPGRYALTLLTPLGPILVEASDTTDTIILDVEAGELTDLGDIMTLLLPERLEP